MKTVWLKILIIACSVLGEGSAHAGLIRISRSILFDVDHHISEDQCGPFSNTYWHHINVHLTDRFYLTFKVCDVVPFAPTVLGNLLDVLASPVNVECVKSETCQGTQCTRIFGSKSRETIIAAIYNDSDKVVTNHKVQQVDGPCQ
jgi:hypothetical protein